MHRMRLLPLVAIAVALLSATLTVPAWGAAVIGIDFGSKYMKVALVKPGRPFEIVLNAHTKRKSDSAFAVYQGERLYGMDAAGLATRKPEQVLFRLRDVLGRNASHPAVEAIGDHFLQYDMQPHDQCGTLKIGMNNIGLDNEFRSLFHAEELVAMLLQYARDMATDFAETPVKDAVITVPSFFMQKEREALLDAAEIAGVNVLALIEENTAAALQYGIDRVYPDGAHRMLVYNMGAQATQVSIHEYTGKYIKRGGQNITQGEFRTMSKYWDTGLGGDTFDDVLLNRFADDFESKNPGSGIRENPRSLFRLKKLANKIKEVLSANNEMPAGQESLHNDKDYRTVVTRDEFEQSLQPLLPRITHPIDVALAAANLTVADLDAIELIGGSTRVPLVKDTLGKYFGEDKELGVHLNGDEAMALGAVFHGANLSTAFRVRHVGMTDIIPYGIGVRLSDMDSSDDASQSDEDSKSWTKQATLFKQFGSTVLRKVLKFQHETDIECALKYEVSDDSEYQLPAGTDLDLAVYEVRGISEANSTHGHLGSPKVSLTFELDVNGISKLMKAEAVFSEMIEVQVPVKKKKKDSTKSDDKDSEEDESEKDADNTDEESDGEKDATQDEASEPEQNEQETGENSDGDENSNDAEEEDDATAEKDTEDNKKDDSEEEKKEEFTTELKKKVHRIPLSIVRTDRGMRVKRLSAELKAEGKKLLEDWHKKDSDKKLHAAEMNTLESFILSSRDRIRSNEEIVEEVATEEEVEKLMEDLMEAEDWLYEDEGLKASVATYKEKRAALAKRVEAIFTRAKELVDRPVVVKDTRQLFSTIREQVATWEKERPWVTEDEKKALLDRVEKVEKWLDEKEAEQAALSPKDAPVFQTSDIRTKLEPVQRGIEKLLKKRKPKPKKPKKKAKETEEEAAEEGAEEEEKKPTEEADAKVEENVNTDEPGTAGDEEKDEL